MTSRQYYDVISAAGEVTNTDEVNWTDIGSGSFTGDASSDYVFFWQAAVTGNVAASINVRVWDGTTAFLNMEVRPNELSAPQDYLPVGGAFVISNGGSPSARTFRIQVRRQGVANTVKGKTAQLKALKLVSGDQFASAGSHVTTTATSTVATITSLAAGDYILFGAGGMSASAGLNIGLQLDWNTAGATAPEALHRTTASASSVREPFLLGKDITSTGGDARLLVRRASGSGGSTAGVEFGYLVALKKSGFDNVYAVNSTADGSGVTSTTYTDASNVSQTFTPAATPHLSIAALWFKSNSTSITSYCQYLDDSATIQEGLVEQPQATVGPFWFAGVGLSTYAASSRTQKMQVKGESGSVTVTPASGSGIFTFDLGAVGASYNDTTTESVTASDTASGAFTLVGSEAETASASDVASNVATLGAIGADALSASDASDGAAVFPVAVAESASAADSQTGGLAFEVATNETTSAVDTSNGSVAANTYDVSASESAAASDTSSAVLTAVGSASESAASTDTSSNVATLVGAASETASAADVPSSLADFASATAEAGSAADSSSNIATIGASVAEAASASDLVSGGSIFGVLTTETASGADSVAAAITLAATASEAASATDTGSCGGVLGGDCAEASGATDAAVSSATLAATMSDSLAAADALSAAAVLVAALVDALVGADATDADVLQAYVTPSERILAVLAEVRRLLVPTEPRANAVSAEHRARAVAAELRAIDVQAEDRSVAVSADDRTL